MLGKLSLRYTIPLNLSIGILFTALVVAAALALTTFGDVHEVQIRHSKDIARALAEPLVESLKHDDPWRAYQVLRSARSDLDEHERTLVLLEEQRRVFAASRPRDYPMQVQLREVSKELAEVDRLIEQRAGQLTPYEHEIAATGNLYVFVPIADDDAVRGTLIVSYPRSTLEPALNRILRRVTYSTLAVMALLLPVAWYVGHRTAAPLVDLARRMQDVGRIPSAEIEHAAEDGEQEIGQLAMQFNQMLEELREKESLERQIVVSERLAAVGRLVAGVAHEINNPLGGMLNAIDTYRRYGRRDEMTDKTVSLLERGLEQIRETVSALLVEAKAGRHGLSHQDIEDVRTLVQPNAVQRQLELCWENNLEGTLTLPSTPIRQMLINLCLNAVQAAPKGGRVSFRIGTEHALLDIHVENDGKPIPEHEMSRLFEPFATSKPSGIGLGLWVTYQIVDQLDGEIVVLSEEGVTSFDVRLPLKEAA